MNLRSITKQRGKLVVLIVAQSLAATFFVFDMLRDAIREMGMAGFVIFGIVAARLWVDRPADL